MTTKVILFDWFTVFKFNKLTRYGKLRMFAKAALKKLTKAGWTVKIVLPNIHTLMLHIAVMKLKREGLPYELLRKRESSNRYSARNSVYIDMAYFYLIGGYWPILRLRCLRKLRRVK